MEFTVMLARFWNWLISWFDKSSALDVYNPKERLIFSYWNGEVVNGKRKLVQADPLVLYKRQMHNGPELLSTMKAAISPFKGAEEAHAEMTQTLREMFNLKPLTNSIEVTDTLSDTEVVDLFDSFLEFTGSVKKKSKNSPTSATEISPTSESSSIANQPTSSSSESGSIASEHTIVNPQPLPTVPVSPLVP